MPTDTHQPIFNAWLAKLSKPGTVNAKPVGGLFQGCVTSKPDFPISTSVVALETGGVTINAGMNDAWVSDDAPFQGFTVRGLTFRRTIDPLRSLCSTISRPGISDQ